METRASVFAIAALAAWVIGTGLGLACASAPAAPAPGRSTAWGYLRVVPNDGTETAGGGSYGDRRLRQVRLVDYSRPGFAVVYSSDESSNSHTETHLHVREGRAGVRLEPTHAAASAGGQVFVSNGSNQARVVSCPEVGVVREIGPGETIALDLPRAGEYAVFLLDVPDAASTVFAAPGAWTVVGESGRWQLENLSPGRQPLHAWHPRLPPTTEWVELSPGVVHRLDLEVGVGRAKPEGAHVE